MLDSIQPSAQSAGTTTCSLFINGQWVSATGNNTFSDFEPATGKLYAHAADADLQDIDSAIAAATGAQPAWEALTPVERASFFYRAAELFADKQQSFAQALIAETGSTFGKAMFECSLIPVALRQAAALTTASIGEILPSNVPGKTNRTIRSAKGVIGVISPWNFPLYLSLRGFVYALALGNTIVLKPSEDSPVSGGILLAELLSEAGFPPGVFNVLTTSRDKVALVGDRFVSDNRIAGLSFTGSTAVGRSLAADCARVSKSIMLEMGGKNPVLVLEDADIDRAVDICFFSAFLHQGQICMSADKIIVASSIYDEFLERLVAKTRLFSPTSPEEQISVIGPIINSRQLNRINNLVSEAASQGATIHCGGKIEGPYFQATVISDVTPSMRIWNEEIFGPATCVVRADNVQQALAMANDTDYGLSAAVITSDLSFGEQVASKINAGMVHVNDSTVHDEPHCPFSGLKASGGGGKWGPQGAVEAFTTQRWLTSQHTANPYPF